MAPELKPSQLTSEIANIPDSRGPEVVVLPMHRDNIVDEGEVPPYPRSCVVLIADSIHS
jgi:hypothetical protein